MVFWRINMVIVALLCATSSWVVGDPANSDAPARARGHFEDGLVLYKEERYQEALDEFERGYALAPRPRFLISIGQCHRRPGALASARVAFRKFLAAVPQDDADRPRVEEMLREVEATLGPDRLALPPEPPTPAPPRTTLPALAGLTAPPPEARRTSRRTWGIAAVAAVVAVSVGVYLMTRDGGAICRSEDLSCVDLR
jgi:tetratricopeptide (TPR) repeat protein